MEFSNSERPITSKDLMDAEASLGIKFPFAMRKLYLLANGGSPNPYVFENEDIDTVVAEFLPLESACKSYDHLILVKKVAPQHFFPFAVDGGGDYFFVDCATAQGAVYFYGSDSAKGLSDLKLGFDPFWSSLKSESE